MIYLDYAATTPINQQVLEVYQQVASRYFGNASSLHDEGSMAKQIVEASSKVISSAFNGSEKGLTFTSGATESNFLVIQALLDGRADDRKEIISSKMEHSSVINVLERLSKKGYQIKWVKVHENGRIDLDHFDQLINEHTALVSIQHVNSELGVIQPIEEIGTKLADSSILFHSDCVQSFGKIDIDVTKWNLDAISISAHKIYGPKGIGAAWINPEVDWKPLFEDQTQKKSLRFGTANTPGIAAFATAVKQQLEHQKNEISRLGLFRQQFIKKLIDLGHPFKVEGENPHQLPTILGARFPGMEGQFLMLECSQAGLAISTGSACQVGSEKPNRSMKAIGRSDEEAREFVRFSFGMDVKEHHIPEIIEKIDSILHRHFSKVHRTLESKT